MWPSERTWKVSGETLWRYSSLCHWLPLWAQAFLCPGQRGSSGAYSTATWRPSVCWGNQSFNIPNCFLSYQFAHCGDLHARVASNCHLCAGSCSRPSCARSRRALWGLTERGEVGSAQNTSGRVRALATRAHYGGGGHTYVCALLFSCFYWMFIYPPIFRSIEMFGFFSLYCHLFIVDQCPECCQPWGSHDSELTKVFSHGTF